MTQEKQKVIRVLKPVQKKKNMSPIYYAIAGVTFGVAVTSVLVFSVLGDDSTSNQTIVQNQNSPASAQPVEVTSDSISTSNTKTPPLVAAADLETEDSNEDFNHPQPKLEDFNHPQPKLNELSNQFKPNKQIATEQKNAHNPFANAAGQTSSEKPVLAQAEKKHEPKAIVTAKTSPTKAVTSQSEATKATAKPAAAKPDEKLTAKAAVQPHPNTIEKETEIDSPRATVQISVTRTTKE